MKQCEYSNYCKDNNKNIYFVCEHCGNEMEMNEVRECTKKYPDHFCAMNDGKQDCECYNEGYLKGRAEVVEKIGWLRQWLNEDRISNGQMVENDDIRHWLEI